MAGCGSDSDSESESAGDEVSLLFVQDADGGNLNDDQLTMIVVSPNTGWFTDRPVRESGQMAYADFLSLWDEGATFDTDPPNADFTCQVDGATVNVVVELSSPFAAINGDELTYNIKRVGDTPAEDFDCDGNTHLFIDSVGDDCARAKAGSLSLPKADLSGCNLTLAKLTGANLTFADLNSADLTLAKLTVAELEGADLTSADLNGTKLKRSNLTLADLTGANLTAADLTGAKLWRANLTNANLTNANLTGADLTKADLEGATGWDTAKGKDTIVGLDKATGVPD